MSNKNLSFVFVLGIAVGIVAWNLVMLAAPTPVYAEATSGTANGIIAVTGMCTNNTSCLWVLDARESATTPTLCMYIPENAGKSIRFAAARRIKWDLQLVQYNDTTPKDMAVSNIRKQVEKAEKEAAKEAAKENK